MVELETREQALTYLAEVSPTETFQVRPFPHGWVCTTVMSPEEMQSGTAVGAARLVIDSETGIVYVYPSWPTRMVAAAHTSFKETGVNQAGRQIYPHQWTITIRRLREDEQTIVYQMTAESLAEPPQPTQAHSLTIDKHTLRSEPRDALSSVAMSHVEWMSRQNNGVWPETATTRV